MRRIARITLPRSAGSGQRPGGDLVQFLNQGASISSRRALRCSSLRPLFGSKLTSKNSTKCLVMAEMSRVFDMGTGVAQAQLNQEVVQGTEQTSRQVRPLSQDQRVQVLTALTGAGGVQGVLVKGSHSVCTPSGNSTRSREVAVVFAILRLEPVGA